MNSSTVRGALCFICSIITTLIISGCSMTREEECICTEMVCMDGITISVRLADGGIFPEGNYSLHWQFGILNGTANPDDVWHHDTSAVDSVVVFFIDNYISEDAPRLTEQKGSIVLELYRNGAKAAEVLSFMPDWILTTCNTCIGPCEDLVSNAEIEMSVTLH